MFAIVGGIGAIFLDGIHCNGNESNLLQCTHDGIAEHDCVHHEDAGVSCGNSPHHSDHICGMLMWISSSPTLQ